MKKLEDAEKDEGDEGQDEETEKWKERESTPSNERLHTTIMPLVFITHVTTVIVPITDPGWGNTSAIITAKLICVAGPDQCGCRDKLYNI